jgi:anti-anti-sigma factor
MPWEVDPGRSRVTVSGQLDIFEAAPLHQALVELARAGRPCHVDLAACDDLDSSALQIFLAFRRACEDRGGRVAFAGAQGRVARLLQWFGLDGEGRR